MSFDISSLLSDWDYEPGKVMVRRFQGDDGVEKIQLRIDLGLLQMNAEGRPDGRRPYGHESLFEHFKAKLEAHAETGEEFALSESDCVKLQQEAIQYYHRYICLYELKDYEGVVRDTERNLEVFDFIEELAESDDLALMPNQMRAQVVMMYTRAKSAMMMDEEDFNNALNVVDEGIEEIRGIYENLGVDDIEESSGEMQFLSSWKDEIQSRRPLSKRERLENALEVAIRQEDYEKAAKMRDALRQLDTQSP